MTLDIDNPVAGWKATHHENRCGGPAEISIGETPLLRDFHCSVEGQSDQRMVPDMTPRVYHKAGLSIFEAEPSNFNDCVWGGQRKRNYILRVAIRKECGCF